MFFLLWDALGQAAELIAGALDLAPQFLASVAIHVLGSTCQFAAGAVGDGDHYIQVTQQLLGRRGRWRRLHLPLRFQKQLGLLQDALPDRRRCIPPGGVQLSGLAGVERVPGERFRHARTVLQAHPRRRHQKLHGDVRRDRAASHLLLDAFRKQFHQPQPARHPTHAAIQAPRQLLQAITEALLQLRQQPALLQRRLAFGRAQGTIQQQRLRFGQGPDHCLHRVPAQLLQRRDALVAVDDQVTIGLARHGHHHDGRLLARGGQRSQQAAFAIGTAHPKMFPAPIELVKL